MSVGRRKLLKMGAALALSPLIGMPFISKARAAGWADITPFNVWPAGFTPMKILEIHCVGGLSPWETFWVHEGPGGTVDFHNFESNVMAMNWHCSGSPQPANETIVFGTDSAGSPVRWGPATKPLWRQDILDRTRLVVLKHSLKPHEAAAPLAITGSRLGMPTMAGTGAAIQHRDISVRLDTGQPPSPLPLSFVLAPANLGPDDYQPALATSTGQHPGSARPVLIRVGTEVFEDLLSRLGSTQEADQLVSIYAAGYRDMLRFQGAGSIVRSRAFSAYDAALRQLLSSSNLNTLLGGGVLSVSNGQVCATVTPTQPAPSDNVIRTQLQVAVKLLNGGAKHVAVFDGGADAVRNYDTHLGPQVHMDLTLSGVFRLCAELAGIIGPGINQIKLSETLIVISSEFGRTTYFDPSGGRDHWPYGYTAVLIGSPVAHQTIAGALGADGWPPNPPGNVGSALRAAVTPSDLRGALLLAAGIDPFAAGNFAVQNFSVNDGTESGTRGILKSWTFGI